jgi:hypothetical protein
MGVFDNELTVMCSPIHWGPLTQSVLIRTVFYLCENTQNSHNFVALFQFCFFSLKDNIRGHLPMKFFFS